VLPQQPQVCTEFIGSQGWRDDSFCFTSPFYPAQYPTTPTASRLGGGQRIELDFKLSSFLIERSSECLNDYLEIRDGPFGYSPPLRGCRMATTARLCARVAADRHGRASPDRLLRSSGRFLWLRFRSDEVIRHRGLRLVYRSAEAFAGKFGKPPAAQATPGLRATMGKCQLRYRIHSAGSSCSPASSSGQFLAPSAQKDAAVECTADFSALREDTKAAVSIATAQFLREGQCQRQLDLRVRRLHSGRQQRKDFQPVCDNLADWTLMAATARLVVRLTAKSGTPAPAAAGRHGCADRSCQSDTEFDCGAGRCIDSRLRCNGYANCPDVEDEGSDCPGRGRRWRCPDSTEKPTGKGDEGHHAVILGTLGGIIIVAVLLSLVCHIRRIRRHRRRQEQGQRDDAACGTPTSEPANGSVRLLSETKLWRQSPSRYVGSSRRLLYLLQLEATGPLFPVPPPPPPPPGLLFQPEPGSLAYLDRAR
uniref:CUB domain-containing protein n=1 Tax=Macrostomum lignano TaxID=282301 RepID=A0A1I8FJV1_9PLAT